MPTKTAVLLTNLGTPNTLNQNAVKQFLRQFLSDPWVVELPRMPWWLLLNTIILPLRSGKILRAYQRIWTAQGSPLLVHAKRQQATLQARLGAKCQVALAMRYGEPSFESVIDELIGSGVDRLIVLPLYPQNSATTCATSFHHLSRVLTHYRHLPSIHFIDSYFEHTHYIAALAQSVREHWAETGDRGHLVMSFHGLPQINIERGDPYQAQCQQSARLLATALGLNRADWSLCFQSRFGKQTWVQPYTEETLNSLVSRGIDTVDVICPGFSADCLETLDEIDIKGRDLFLQSGGAQFRYIAALNSRNSHIDMMQVLVEPLL